MENITIINANNESVNVRVIRYFELNNNNYFIYSLNEIDDQNYVKLYAVKVENQNGAYVGSSIVNEEEWNAVKELIKVIIKGNKDGVAEVADLNHNELDSLSVTNARAFKLASQLADLLAANKKIDTQTLQLEPELIANEPNIAPESNNEMETDNIGEIPSVDDAISNTNMEPSKDLPTNSDNVGSSIETPDFTQTTVNDTSNKREYQNVEVEYYKNLYLKEKQKNEELTNKINEIKKIIGLV
ncbi:MAG: DUF1292 domain-containing protein [Mollicutes bacterium]|nr:DUF1292 domain-containing protein [Mollicutes bacterium]